MMFHDTQAGKFTQAEMVGSGWLWMAHAPVRKSLPAAAAWAVLGVEKGGPERLVLLERICRAVDRQERPVGQHQQLHYRPVVFCKRQMNYIPVPIFGILYTTPKPGET